MKAISIHSPGVFLTCALLILSPLSKGQCAPDVPKKKAETSEEKPKPAKGVKGEKRREIPAQKELREELEKTRAELERTRASLHEAHKELGSKAESISTLEAKLSSVTAQLEKTRNDLKKVNSIAETVEKQERQLEASRKQIAELQKEIKAVEKKAADAIASAKASASEKRSAKTVAPNSGSAKKATSIAPILYEAASAVNYPERDRALKQVIDALEKSPTTQVQITGHADDSQYVQTNEDVSTNRAKFLAAYFVINGVPEDRIVIKGLGNTMPLKKGQPNRRVEITLIP